MRFYHINGVVLKRINIGEADRLLIVYSKELGKLRLIGKGLRKITSRRSAHLEIFTQSAMVIRDSKTLPYITEVSSLYSFKTIRTDFRKIAICYHLSEIIDKLLPDGEKNEYIYEMYVDFLKKIDENSIPEAIRKSVRLFVYGILSHLGYLNTKRSFTYSQLLGEVEAVIERPLQTVKLLHTISTPS